MLNERKLNNEPWCEPTRNISPLKETYTLGLKIVAVQHALHGCLLMLHGWRITQPFNEHGWVLSKKQVKKYSTLNSWIFSYFENILCFCVLWLLPGMHLFFSFLTGKSRNTFFAFTWKDLFWTFSVFIFYDKAAFLLFSVRSIILDGIYRHRDSSRLLHSSLIVLVMCITQFLGFWYELCRAMSQKEKIAELHFATFKNTIFLYFRSHKIAVCLTY